MEEKKTLNLETFNDILCNVGGIDRKELLEHEIQMAYGVKIQKMEELVQALNNGMPYHNALTEVNNIDSNLDVLAAELEELESESESEG